MELDVIEQLEGLDVSIVTKERARELLEGLVLYYITDYVKPGKKMPGVDPSEAARMIREYHTDLLDRLELSTFDRVAIERIYKQAIKRTWSDRNKIANDLVYRNLARQEKAMRIIEEALDSDDPAVRIDVKLAAMDRMVAIEKRQAAIAGYDSPQKYEVFAGSGQEQVFTEETKRQIADEIRQWEQEQFGGELPETIEIVEDGG